MALLEHFPERETSVGVAVLRGGREVPNVVYSTCARMQTRGIDKVIFIHEEIRKIEHKSGDILIGNDRLHALTSDR